MKSTLLKSVAFAALIVPNAVYAQSTGSIDFEEDAAPEVVVVTGTRTDNGISGVVAPDTSKAKAVLTQELISTRAAGQTILDTINMVPGVSFTNSDAYGTSGGQIRIRGFDGNRISLTFDGVPLNDSGNYSIYSNQMLDPELIDQVNVNFGAAEVDSPTASASGGTVNYRSMTPKDELGATAVYSHGSNDMNRVFGMLNIGRFTPFGTKAWVSASTQSYDQFRGPGRLKKTQFNGKIYQPIGSGGDFVSIAGHYNENRNNFYSNPTLANMRTVLGTTVVPSTGITSDTPYTVDLTNDQFDTVFDNSSNLYRYDRFCTLASATGVNGTSQNDRTTCSNIYSTAQNPSNTGNVRLNSRFGITDALTLTVDAAAQFVKANGGGSSVLAESDANATQSGVYSNQRGRLGAGVATGVDINGDGDMLDYVRVYFPSNTRTRRYTVIAGLRYKINDNHQVRLAYTWDRARHRQTGEASRLTASGAPVDNFSGVGSTEDYQIFDAAGNVFQKRNRLSYAILNQISAEYRGEFFDDALTVSLGVRAPFFKRDLNNYCYTIPGSSSDAYCTSQTAAQVAANTTTATYGAPYTHRIKKYDAILPNLGFTFDVMSGLSMFGNYAKGFSAPRTDNLYAFDDVTITPTDEVKPEKTNSFDLGFRYRSSKVQAQLAGWYIYYSNRIISSLVELEGGGTLNVDRNVGATKTKGVDFSLNYRPFDFISLYGYVSYIDSELKADAVNPLTGAVIAATKGKFVVETPKWQYGGFVRFSYDALSAGVSLKHTGDRFVTDVNDLVSSGYTVVDMDVRVNMGFMGMKKTYFQLNANNVFNERYFGNLSTGTSASSSTRFSFGAPRSLMGSIHFEF